MIGAIVCNISIPYEYEFVFWLLCFQFSSLLMPEKSSGGGLNAWDHAAHMGDLDETSGFNLGYFIHQIFLRAMM